MFSTYIAPVEIAIIVHWTLTWWAGMNTNATNSLWLSMNCNKSCALNPIQNYISSRSLTRGQIIPDGQLPILKLCQTRVLLLKLLFIQRCYICIDGPNIRFSINFHIRIVNRNRDLRSIASAIVLKSLTRYVNYNVQQCTRIFLAKSTY